MKFNIQNARLLRLDDRLSTLENTDHIEVALVSRSENPGIRVAYGLVAVGITGVITTPVPLIIAERNLTEFGVIVHRDMMFPRGIPDGYGGLQWDCWYAPFRTGYEIEVLGVQP